MAAKHRRASVDERARQAEMDAARAREIEEERTSRQERIGSSALAKLDGQLTKAVTARVVREYIRSEMIEPIVKRMYDIGMGVETFDVPTMAGNVVNVPASALTQLKALLGLVQVGVPSQIGLVDDDGQTLPGAIVLGELDMQSARAQVHSPRLNQVSEAFGTIIETALALDSALSPAMQFEVVEVDEGIDAAGRHEVDQAPPPIDPSEMTPEQIILAKRRARKAQAHD